LQFLIWLQRRELIANVFRATRAVIFLVPKLLTFQEYGANNDLGEAAKHRRFRFAGNGAHVAPVA
jgi:hypothetical protein